MSSYILHNRQSHRRRHAMTAVPRVELVVTSGRARRPVRQVEGPVFLIGASSDCDLVLGDPLLPAVHSYLLLTAYGVRLRHLGAKPALVVNGCETEVTHVNDGDQVTIGPFSFELRIRNRGTLASDALTGPHGGHGLLVPFSDTVNSGDDPLGHDT